MSTMPPRPTEAAPVIPCRVSIVIKAFNEEEHICAAIESSLSAVSRVGGEVILADACSTDRTVALASGYPIRIVQLSHAEERSCGAGPQLGYQHTRGDYIYIMDGDQQMAADFLEQALPLLHSRKDLAGIGGLIVEQNLTSHEFRNRADRAAKLPSAGPVERLDCGGLYRRSAIEEVGYFSDRHLHSYEEFDLGARLRARGWLLWRLPLVAVMHFGHTAPPYSLLLRRWRSGYVCGLGELLRAAVGQPHLGLVIREVRELRLYATVLLWWALLAAIAAWPLPLTVRLAGLCGLVLTPVLAMAWQKRSFARGLHAVVSWCVNTAGLLRGLARSQPSSRAIESRVLQDRAAQYKNADTHAN